MLIFNLLRFFNVDKKLNELISVILFYLHYEIVIISLKCK